MSKKDERIRELQDSAFEAYCELKKGRTAINDILVEYDVEVDDPVGAVIDIFANNFKFGDCSPEKTMNEWISQFNHIMWLLNVAYDYTIKAMNILDKISEPEV